MTDPSSALLRARYGVGDAPEAGWSETLDPLIASLLSHRSVRSYLPDPLPEWTLPTMMAAAQSAATSSNLQSWSVVAVEDAGRRQRLSVLAGDQAHVRTAPLFLAWIADLARVSAIGAELDQPTAATAYLEATLLGVIDVALAAQNAVVALEAMGLGTVYIGGLRNHPEEVAAELGLPPHSFAVFGLCVGWPDPAQPAAVKPRLPQAAVLHRERYNAAGQAEALDRFDAVSMAFQRSQGMRQVPWTRQTAARLKGPEAMSGRDRLRAALEALRLPTT